MTLQRIPESALVMNDLPSIAAFSDAGLPQGPLFAIYHFNAACLSRRLPQGATVLDIGCGSGRFVSYLLQGRPDVQAVAVDLSDEMLHAAYVHANESGVKDRIQFVKSDFTMVDDNVSQSVDAVICLSALHHCPTTENLTDALSAIHRVSERGASAVWLFDLVRPKERSLAHLIPRTFEISSATTLAEDFRVDWENSLLAGWTFAELSDAIADAGLKLTGVTANYSQLHFAGDFLRDVDHLWKGSPPADADLIRATSIQTALGVF